MGPQMHSICPRGVKYVGEEVDEMEVTGEGRGSSGF